MFTLILRGYVCVDDDMDKLAVNPIAASEYVVAAKVPVNTLSTIEQACGTPLLDTVMSKHFGMGSGRIHLLHYGLNIDRLISNILPLTRRALQNARPGSLLGYTGCRERPKNQLLFDACIHVNNTCANCILRRQAPSSVFVREKQPKIRQEPKDSTIAAGPPKCITSGSGGSCDDSDAGQKDAVSNVLCVYELADSVPAAINPAATEPALNSEASRKAERCHPHGHRCIQRITLVAPICGLGKIEHGPCASRAISQNGKSTSTCNVTAKSVQGVRNTATE